MWICIRARGGKGKGMRGTVHPKSPRAGLLGEPNVVTLANGTLWYGYGVHVTSFVRGDIETIVNHVAKRLG
jgi:hypothetical protein